MQHSTEMKYKTSDTVWQIKLFMQRMIYNTEADTDDNM